MELAIFGHLEQAAVRALGHFDDGPLHIVELGDDVGVVARHVVDVFEDFESFVAEGGEVASIEALTEGLRAIIAGHDILRLKGFAAIRGKPMRLVVQAVGQRIETYFDRPFAPGEARETRLVVIGLHDAIEDGEAAIRDAVGALGESPRAAAE